MATENLTGKKFGRLMVLNESKTGKWNCECSCGNRSIVFAANLKRGHTKSCGCLARETSSKGVTKRNITHSGTGTRLYEIWHGMKQRCLNKNHIHYKNYGGRGIVICDEWLNDFVNFRDWSKSKGYTKDLTLDRKDNNKGYSPNNCRWVTFNEQANNRSNNILYKGETAAQASRRLGGNENLVSIRIFTGWPIKKAFTLPLGSRFKKSCSN